jgi:hypothetical protein
LFPCATTCPPFGLTIYTAPLKGALFVSCCGTGSAFAIGSAVAKDTKGERTAKRLQSADCRIFLVMWNTGDKSRLTKKSQRSTRSKSSRRHLEALVSIAPPNDPLARRLDVCKNDRSHPALRRATALMTLAGLHDSSREAGKLSSLLQVSLAHFGQL